MNDGGGSTESAERSITHPKLSPRVQVFLFSRYLLALLIGAAGALLFVYLRMPLPWFLGALTFCLIASVLKAPILRPMPLAIPCAPSSASPWAAPSRPRSWGGSAE